MAEVLNADAAKAKQLLQAAGYDGTPVVLMQSTDLPVLTNLAPVAKAQLEAAASRSRCSRWTADAGRPAHQEGSAGPRAAGTPS